MVAARARARMYLCDARHILDGVLRATLRVSRLVTRWIYELNIFHWWWFLSLPAAAMVRLVYTGVFVLRSVQQHVLLAYVATV